jgi:hypothetical protein
MKRAKVIQGLVPDDLVLIEWAADHLLFWGVCLLSFQFYRADGDDMYRVLATEDENDFDGSVNDPSEIFTVNWDTGFKWKRVLRSDLPLYIWLPHKSRDFERILKGVVDGVQ